ncbi:MAG: DKNYY domain-containing protein [Nitrosomonas sp.]|nr:DKNYY domain-containing protein [Nitrosomonas sp.]
MKNPLITLIVLLLFIFGCTPVNEPLAMEESRVKETQNKELTEEEKLQAKFGGKYSCYHITLDDQHVYLNNDIVPNADPVTFEAISGQDILFKDSQAVFKLNIGEACGTSLIRFKNADVKSFQVIDYDYSKDVNHVYYRTSNETTPGLYGKIIEGADPLTFEILISPYAKDKNYIYENGKRLEGVNVETFNLPW